MIITVISPILETGVNTCRIASMMVIVKMVSFEVNTFSLRSQLYCSLYPGSSLQDSLPRVLSLYDSFSSLLSDLSRVLSPWVVLSMILFLGFFFSQILSPWFFIQVSLTLSEALQSSFSRVLFSPMLCNLSTIQGSFLRIPIALSLQGILSMTFFLGNSLQGIFPRVLSPVSRVSLKGSLSTFFS